MSDQVYYKLAKVLDTLPNGFPPTESGIEIKLLKKIFTPDEADLFCDLRLTTETAEEISARTGRPLEGLEDKLTSMWERGEVWGQVVDDVKSFKMIPWIVGIFEFQNSRMDLEFCELCEEYAMHFGMETFSFTPHLLQVIPIEEEISADQQVVPYEQLSNIIENGKSFSLNSCICKKEKGFLGNPCSKPEDVCMWISDVPDFHNNSYWGNKISKEEAYDVLRKSEEAGLVHMTTNIQEGQWFICNCCGCCCGGLISVKMGITSICNAHYYADIDQDKCDECGVCLEERCQTEAIEETDEGYMVIKSKCVGCGLCATTCESEAIKIYRKPEDQIFIPPKNENEWMEERARSRGIDYSALK